MLKRPRFKTCYRVEINKPDQVFLLNDLGSRYLLYGADYVKLAPFLLDGKTLPENWLSDPNLVYALLRLEQKGFLEEQERVLSPALSAFCHLIDCPPRIAEKKLQKTAVSICCFGKTSPRFLSKALRSLGIQISDLANEGDFIIAMTDNYRRKELRELGKTLQKKGKPWCLIKPCSAELWMGPLFAPQKTGCYECLFQRLCLNQTEDLYIEKKNKKKEPIGVHLATLPTIEPLACNAIASEIFKWIVKGECELLGKILSCNVSSHTWMNHFYTKKKECKVCGSSQKKHPVYPLTLESRKKHFIDGGHREISPEETIKKYQHLISPITGIVSHLTPMSVKANPHAHVFHAGHVLDVSRFWNRPYFESKRTASGGKGKTIAQAQASCLCEAIERFSGVFQGNEFRKKTSYSKIRDKAIHPHSLLLFSDKQYQMRAINNLGCSTFHLIPELFNEEHPIDWTPVWSLTEKRTKWVPTSFCYYCYSFAKGEPRFCLGDSNGCAAGSTVEEAILQGFFELVERDAVAIWWYNRLHRPGVDLQSFRDPYIDQILANMTSSERKFWVLDLTMDLQIPTFAAISYRPDGENEEIVFGFGSQLDPLIAIHRAITEMHQMEATLHAESEKIETSKNPVLVNWRKKAKLENHRYLVADPRLDLKNKEDYSHIKLDDIKTEVIQCQNIVEAKGLEMLVLDQTRSDIALPVVRVIVPGLRHFWNRFAPGRLYDVPVNLGLMKNALKEEDLNPIPMFV